MKLLLSLYFTLMALTGFAQDVNVSPVLFVKDSTRDYTWKFNNRLLRYTSGFALTDSTALADSFVSYRYQNGDLKLAMSYKLENAKAGTPSAANGKKVIDYITIEGDLPTLTSIFNGLMRIELTTKMLTRRKGIIGKVLYSERGPVHYYSFNPKAKAPAEWLIIFF